MVWPPANLPLAHNRANATVTTTNHPNDHNTIANALDDIVSRVAATTYESGGSDPITNLGLDASGGNPLLVVGAFGSSLSWYDSTAQGILTAQVSLSDQTMAMAVQGIASPSFNANYQIGPGQGAQFAHTWTVYDNNVGYFVQAYLDGSTGIHQEFGDGTNLFGKYDLNATKIELDHYDSAGSLVARLRLDDDGILVGATGQKVGFLGATPVAQAATPTTLAHVITIIRNLGFAA